MIVLGISTGSKWRVDMQVCVPLIHFKVITLLLFFSVFVQAKKIRLEIATYPEQLDSVVKAIITDDCVLGDTVPDNGNYVVAEAIVLCKALRLGGIDPEFEVIAAPSQQRALRAMEQGLFFTASYSFWGKDFNSKYLYKTTQVLPRGEYFKGIYTTKSNTELLSIKNISGIKSFTGVSNRLWKKDWVLLECLGVETVDTKNHINMAKMVSAGRVDFTLARIKGEGDFSYSLFGEEVVPVPNIRLVFNDTHTFLVSKKYPHAKQLFESLERGLDILRKSGELYRIYRLADFYKEELKSWKAYVCENGEIKKFIQPDNL